MNGRSIERNAQVEASDGPVGRVKHVIVDPDSREVTDLVVQDDDQEWMVPITAVSSADGGHVQLRGTRADVYSAHAFNRAGFHPVDEQSAREESQGRAIRGGAPLIDAADDAVRVGGLNGEPPRVATDTDPDIEHVQSTSFQQSGQPPVALTDDSNDGGYRLQLKEEQLRVVKQQEQIGAVRVSKRVVKRIETIDVPVREEYLVVEQIAGSGVIRIGDRALGDGETVELTLYKERAVASTEVVVAEDITVRKEMVERSERIEETVRREELVVDGPRGRVSGDLGDAVRSGGSRAGRGSDPGTPRAGDSGAVSLKADTSESGAWSAHDGDTVTLPRSTSGGPHGGASVSPQSGPLSREWEAAGTAVVGDRQMEYTYPPDQDAGNGELAVGLPVVTRDGEPLGTIGEIESDRFRVSALMAADYWLPRGAVMGMAPGGDIQVNATKDTLDTIKIHAGDSR